MTKKELINARKLKKMILGKNNFSRWIKENIEKYNLQENMDYYIEQINNKSTNRRVRNEYFLTEKACKKIIYSQLRSELAEKIKQKLEKGEKINDIIVELDKPLKETIRILKFKDEEFPNQLRRIKNPPKQLYVMGNIENLKEKGIAVIGSRNCSNYGRSICKIFTNNLVGYNLNIISGLAVGIDSCAHKACLESQGKTIAVLPSGFEKIYPIENEELVQRIIENGGTVITEYPPEFEKTIETCRERNRIMSGLAIATLVVEAEQRSGTSITVRYANEQQKKVFCVPSSLLNSKGIGTNEMIKQGRAKIVTKAEDIIEEFPELKSQRKENFNFLDLKKKKRQKEKVNDTPKIEDENLEIYNILMKKEQSVDDIAKELNKPVSEISYKLTLLELEGAIEKLPGNKYKIK